MRPGPAIALLVIDLQKAIDDPRWAKDGPRNNPEAEANVARLLVDWRKAGRPIIHIRHDSTEPQSSYRPGQPGNEFKPEALPLPGETIIAKRTNSAFIGTELESRLRRAGIKGLVVAGVITNDKAEIQKRPNYGGFYRSSRPLPAVLPAVGRSLSGRGHGPGREPPGSMASGISPSVLGLRPRPAPPGRRRRRRRSA